MCLACSVGGAVLLVVGLYCVLWGKKKEEGKSVTNDEENTETKEETILESTTTTNHWLLIWSMGYKCSQGQWLSWYTKP